MSEEEDLDRLEVEETADEEEESAEAEASASPASAPDSATTPAELPAEVVAAAARAKMDLDDPAIAVFVELTRAREGVVAAAREDRRALAAGFQAMRQTVGQALAQQKQVLEAQERLLREKAGAAQEIIQRAAERAAASAADDARREVRQQGGRTSAALERQLAQALREAAALDRRTWRDKALPPALAGAAAGVVLALLLAAGWWLWARPLQEQAEAYAAVQTAYNRLSVEQRRAVDEILWGGAGR